MQNNAANHQRDFVSTFSLIKRFTVDIKILKNQFPEELRSSFDNVTAQGLQLTEMDLFDAVENFIRLQTMYKFKTEDLMKGIIGGEKISPELTTHDLFTIGKEIFKTKTQDYLAQEYFHIVYEKIKIGQFSDKEVDERFLLLSLVSSYNRTGQFQKAINTVNVLVNKYAEYKRLIEVRKVLEVQEKKFGSSLIALHNPFEDTFEKNGKYSVEKDENVFTQACRGNLKRANKDDSRLKCGFVYLYKKQFTRLAQFKVEEVNMNPYVVVFHDVLTAQEVDHLKHISKSKVRWNQRATGSVAKSTLLSKEIDDKVVERISQRVEVS